LYPVEQNELQGLGLNNRNEEKLVEVLGSIEHNEGVADAFDPALLEVL
jgi:hypothetical protein